MAGASCLLPAAYLIIWFGVLAMARVTPLAALNLSLIQLAMMFVSGWSGYFFSGWLVQNRQLQIIVGNVLCVVLPGVATLAAFSWIATAWDR